MKKSVMLVVLLALLASCAYAQEEPIPPRRGRAAKVGLFGGFTPSWLKLDVAPINQFLAGSGVTPFEDNGVMMLGGGGAAYIMLVPNLRVGGMGLSGGKSTSSVLAGIRRDADLHVGFGGVTIEYVISIVERLDLAIGVMAGGGGIDIVLRQDRGGLETWDAEKSLLSGWPTASPTNITRTLSSSFFVYVPSVNLEYAVLGWLALRVGASYVGMAAPSWKVDGKHEMSGVPGGVSGKGLTVNGGVLLGTF